MLPFGIPVVYVTYRRDHGTASRRLKYLSTRTWIMAKMQKDMWLFIEWYSDLTVVSAIDANVSLAIVNSPNFRFE